MNQEALRARILLELDLVTVDAMEVVRDLAPHQLAWHPPGGGWSLGQVLEHIILTNDSYHSRIRGLVYFHHAAHDELGITEWEPTLAGWLLVSAMRSKWRMRAPRLWRPGPEPRPDVVRAFLERQDTLTKLIRASAALAWRRVLTTSPARSFVRLNLGDCFTIMIVHAERHVRQLQRIRDRSGFPA